MRRTITALAFALVAVLPLTAAAELTNLAEAAKAQRALLGEHPEDRLPDVIVPEVTLSKTFYEQGEDVSGSARVTNRGSLPARVMLATAVIEGQGDDGEIVVFGQPTEAVELASGEEAVIPFSVRLPVGRPFSGARVEVTVKLDGSASLDWDYSPFFGVGGDGDFAYISFANFGDGEPLLSGPFVREGEALPINIEVFSGLAGGEVLPTIHLVNRAADAEASYTGDPIALVAGYATGRVVVSPGDLLPGVYEGELKISGRGGRTVSAPPVPLRVVVDGDSATVHAVHSSVAAVSRGDRFSVFVEGAGTPIDVRRPSSPESRAWSGTVRITARDARGEEVAAGEWRGTIGDSFSAEVPMVASDSAAEMRGLVEVVDGAGRVIFSREYALVAAAGAAVADPVDAGERGWLAAAVSLIGATILLVILVALRRRREAAASVLAATLIAFAALASGPGGATAEALPAACDDDPGCFLGANEWAEVVANKAPGNPWQAIYDRMRLSCEVCDSPLSGNTNLISDTGTVPSEVNATSININLFRPNGTKINLPGQRPRCGETLRVEAKATFLACENTGIVGQMSSQLFFLPNGPSGVEEALSPIQVEHIRKGSFGRGHSFFPFTYTVNYTSDRITKDGWYRVYVHAGSSDGVSSVTSGRIDFVDFYVGDCDKCSNLEGVQNFVPAGMVRSTGGVCQCPSGSTYDATDGRCEDENGICSTCAGCPSGKKYCDGVCIDESAACSVQVVGQCPVLPNDEQYCVQLFRATDADGDGEPDRTDQMSGYTYAELEQVFGFGLRDAFYDAKSDLSAGRPAAPVWGVVGRYTPFSDIGSHRASAGCAGALCAYTAAGCLDSVDPVSNDTRGVCGTGADLAAPDPMLSIEVEPSVIGKGGQCNVYWSSHEMRTCQVSGQGLSSTALAGVALTPPLNESAVYTLACVGLDGLTYEDADTCSVDPDVAEF
jgi:hypothetical protein